MDNRLIFLYNVCFAQAILDSKLLLIDSSDDLRTVAMNLALAKEGRRLLVQAC